jgi:hypothetical protein
LTLARSWNLVPDLRRVPCWVRHAPTTESRSAARGRNRLAHLDLNHAPIANFFQHLAHVATPKAKAILVKADQVADELGLDDEVVEGLLVGLGLE